MKSINDIDWEKEKYDVISSNLSNSKKMKTLLDSKGCGFCLAKWTQVTMHLGTGLTHSCHHPNPHKIPIDEIKKNPGALHNTAYKKKQRKAMLNGERPAECDYCWRVEDAAKESGNENYSDRVFKSVASFSVYEHDKIVNLTGDEDDIYPTYLEVSFSNVCNFKCSYCNPNFSSKWVQEIKQHGWYVLPEEGYNFTPNVQIPESEDNPYTEAFWKWFPEAKKHLHTLRITGGEPLMSKHTFKLLEDIRDNPTPNMELSINTNGNAPAKNWKRFLELIENICNLNKVQKFTLFISCEGWGQRSEYSRDGQDFNDFLCNVEEFLRTTHNSRLVFMSAFNLFAVSNVMPFLKYVLQLKKEFNYNGLLHWFEEKTNGQTTRVLTKHNWVLDGVLDESLDDRPVRSLTERKNLAKRNPNERVGVDIAYVRYPDFLDVGVVGTEELLLDHLIPALDFMYKNNENTEWTKFQGFTDWEAGKLKRIVEMLVWQLEKGTTKWEKKSRLARERFYAFVNEYDKRRGKDFLKTFPEMKNFYNFCKQLHDESHVTQAGDTEYYHNDESGNRVRQVPVDAKHFYSKPVKSKGYSKA
tara:strand:+ start:447 stop:2195 length:1749 start_codon:yes stop_codon:yes gene_type:complete